MTNIPKGSFSLAEALNAARETRRLEIGSGINREIPRVFCEQFGSRPAIVVADQNTFAVAGKGIIQSLRPAGVSTLEPYIFDDADLYAEIRFVERLEGSLKQHQAVPIAVGSGTINDLTKLASHRTDRPYLCAATAA